MKNLIYIVLMLFIFHANSAWSKSAAEDYYENAVKLFSQKEYNAAVIEVKNALQANSEHLPSRLLLGNAYMKLQQASAAERELLRALRLGASKEQVTANLGNALLIQRKYQEILDHIQLAGATLPSDYLVYSFRGRAHLELGQLDKAEIAFDTAIEMAKNSVEPIIGQALVRARKGHLNEGMALLEQAFNINPTHPEVWFEKGNLYRAQEQWDRALEAYNRTIIYLPGHMRAHSARALLHMQLGNYQAAHRDAETVYLVNNNDPQITFIYSQTEARLGNKEKAAELLRETATLLERLSGDALMSEPGVLKIAALMNLMQHNTEQARFYFTRYLQQKPYDVAIRKLLAELMLLDDDPREAIAILYPAYRTNANDAGLLSLLGEAYQRSNKYGQALIVLERAAELAPSDAEIKTRLGLSQLGLGITSEAESELHRAFELGTRESTSSAVILALLHMRGAEFEEAIRIASTQMARFPDNPLLPNLLGFIYVKSGNFAEARNLFLKALSIDAAFVPALHNMALLNLREGKRELAEQQLRSIVTSHPSTTSIYTTLAKIAESKGDIDAAISWLVKASSKVEDISPRIRLVELYLNNNASEQALAEAESLVELEPENPRALQLLAESLATNNRKREAVEKLRIAVDYTGLNGDLLMSMVRDQLELQDYNGARASLNKALSTDVSDAAQIALVRLDLVTGNMERALSGANALLAQQPERAIGDTLLGEIFIKEGSYEDALNAYLSAYAKEQTVGVALGLHRAQLKVGQSESAIQTLLDWQQSRNWNVEVQRQLAITYMALGQFQSAQTLLEELLKKGQRDVVVLSGLARIYQLNEDSRARHMALRALKASPKWPIALDTYGWILVTEGDVAQGLKYLREAVSRDPNLLMRYHLASALKELGRFEEARAELEVILRSNQDVPYKLDAQELYDEISSS